MLKPNEIKFFTRRTRKVAAFAAAVLLVCNGPFVLGLGLDATFDADGKVLTDIDNEGLSDKANAVAIQSDGKILVAGRHGFESTDTGGNSNFAVARYNINGSLDTSFHFDGTFDTGVGGDDEAYALGIQSTGKIVLIGRTGDRRDVSSPGLPDGFPAGECSIGMLRVDSNGIYDTSFGSGMGSMDGLTTDDQLDEAFAGAIQTDDRIVAAGRKDFAFAVTRYDPDGLSAEDGFDGTLGDMASARKPFGNIGGFASGVVIQPDGKIVATGLVDGKVGLARLNTDGTTDFAVTTNVGGTAWGKAVALQPDGKIVVAAVALSATSVRDFAILRFNSNGTLDTSFDGDGVAITAVSVDLDEANAIAILPNGNIVAAGITNGQDFAVVQYKPNGAAVASTVTDFGGGFDEPRGCALQADGRLVVVGQGQPNTNTTLKFALARYDFFDFCVKDDGAPNSVVRIMLSGEYVFCCSGSVTKGKGTVTIQGCVITLTHNTPTRRVLVKVDTCTRRGSASLQSPPGVTKCTVIDRDISNNNCSSCN